MSLICLFDGCMDPAIDPDNARCIKHSLPIYAITILSFDVCFGRIRVLLDDIDPHVFNNYFGLIETVLTRGIGKLNIAIKENLVKESKKYKSAKIIDVEKI